MQCVNCHFENMPGITTCGRCGASLQLASAVIDVHPPRASRMAKRWRHWFPLSRYWYRLRAANLLSRIPHLHLHWPSELPPVPVLLKMIVPGWAQWSLGRNARAKWMFGVYLGLVLSSILFLGTAIGWLLLGLAVAVHAASVMDVLGTDIFDVRQRLAYTCAAVAALTLLVYYPIGRLVATVASPQYFNMDAPPFYAGDVLLANPSAYWHSDPQPGDLVHYELPTLDVPIPGQHMVYRLRGDRIDRIIAKDGQTVTCSQGKLLVDGQPATWSPLGAVQFADSLNITVPANHYLIFPSTDRLRPDVQSAAILIHRDHIWGRVYWRSQPLWRFGPIH
jgi:signal peptidase I